ncbi:polysaccharide biosynthesis/export protein [Porphyromonas gingivalis]|nr:polysaccharide biosynthesis/export protein [Porphyromonas gingivalis]
MNKSHSQSVLEVGKIGIVIIFAPIVRNVHQQPPFLSYKSIMRIVSNFLFVSFLVLLFASCRSQREKVVYLQDIQTFNREIIAKPYDVKIEKDDVLNILVSSRDPELSTPYNQVLTTRALARNGYGTNSNEGFLVDSKGYINYPILGQIYVEGLTRTELEKEIQKRIISSGFIKDPTVTVQLQNFKVSVLGEVNHPGSMSVKGERITLLEAIGMAGDLTIYGRRDRVFVIRETDGHREVFQTDLRKADLLTSPVYYLHQNDVIYVEPNDKKTQMSEINQNNNVNVWLSVTSTLVSISTLTITIIDKTK